jgi:hypothetical protein
MTQEEKQKYIGRKVYAGSDLKGYYGTIIDIVPDEDMPDQHWFIISDGNGTVGWWGKNELRKEIITTVLIPLE